MSFCVELQQQIDAGRSGQQEHTRAHLGEKSGRKENETARACITVGPILLRITSHEKQCDDNPVVDDACNHNYIVQFVQGLKGSIQLSWRCCCFRPRVVGARHARNVSTVRAEHCQRTLLSSRHTHPPQARDCARAEIEFDQLYSTADRPRALSCNGMPVPCDIAWQQMCTESQLPVAVNAHLPVPVARPAADSRRPSCGPWGHGASSGWAWLARAVAMAQGRLARVTTVSSVVNRYYRTRHCQLSDAVTE